MQQFRWDTGVPFFASMVSSIYTWFWQLKVLVTFYNSRYDYYCVNIDQKLIVLKTLNGLDFKTYCILLHYYYDHVCYISLYSSKTDHMNIT